MEMREINKDLKLHFGRLERQVEEYKRKHETREEMTYKKRMHNYEDEDLDVSEMFQHKRGRSKKRDHSDNRQKYSIGESDKENAAIMENIVSYVGSSTM